MVSGGVGFTLLPGRVRDVFKDKVQLIALQPQYLMRQTIGVSFMRTRERDPEPARPVLGMPDGPPHRPRLNPARFIASSRLHG